MAFGVKKRGTLHSAMGRPRTGPMGSFPAAMADSALSLRRAHPGWGPATLLRELSLDPRWQGGPLPSRGTVAALIRSHGLQARREPNVPLPLPACQRAKRSHSLWQVDGQGNRQARGAGPVAMINIKDVVSKVYVACFPARMGGMQGHPSTSDYRTALRLGFMGHGLPKRVQSDHASVFYDNRSRSPFPTVFCLWLVSLGIAPCFSRMHRPTDQGAVERAHRTVAAQVLERAAPFRGWQDLFGYCQQRRRALNEELPSSATGGGPPLVERPGAAHSGRHYHPANEAGMVRLGRVFAFLAKGKWYRKIGGNRTVHLGGHAYYVPGGRPGQQLAATFCPHRKRLLFHDGNGDAVHSAGIKGISVESLMGELAMDNFPNVQLELPFTWRAQKIDTTFSNSKLARLS